MPNRCACASREAERALRVERGASQDIGRQWLDDGRTLAFVVPSAIVPQEANYVLNVRHPLFAGVKAAKPEPF